MSVKPTPVPLATFSKREGFFLEEKYDFISDMLKRGKIELLDLEEEKDFPPFVHIVGKKGKFITVPANVNEFDRVSTRQLLNIARYMGYQFIVTNQAYSVTPEGDLERDFNRGYFRTLFRDVRSDERLIFNDKTTYEIGCSSCKLDILYYWRPKYKIMHLALGLSDRISMTLQLQMYVPKPGNDSFVFRAIEDLRKYLVNEYFTTYFDDEWIPVMERFHIPSAKILELFFPMVKEHSKKGIKLVPRLYKNPQELFEFQIITDELKSFEEVDFFDVFRLWNVNHALFQSEKTHNLEDSFLAAGHYNSYKVGFALNSQRYDLLNSVALTRNILLNKLIKVSTKIYKIIPISKRPLALKNLLSLTGPKRVDAFREFMPWTLMEIRTDPEFYIGNAFLYPRLYVPYRLYQEQPKYLDCLVKMFKLDLYVSPSPICVNISPASSKCEDKCISSDIGRSPPAYQALLPGS